LSYLVDTCVLSELARPSPSKDVTQWLDQAEETDLYLSVLTLGELEKGVARLPSSARRRKIEKWIREDLAERFGGRLLAVDQPVAERWGRISGEAELRGEPLPVIDALIAATSLVHGLDIVTRNTADMERCGARCINPWRQASG